MTPAWRRRWDITKKANGVVVLKHDRNIAIVLPTGLSPSHVNRLLSEAARVYGYGQPKKRPADTTGAAK